MPTMADTQGERTGRRLSQTDDGCSINNREVDVCALSDKPIRHDSSCRTFPDPQEVVGEHEVAHRDHPAQRLEQQHLPRL